MDTLNRIIELMRENDCDNQKLASALGLNRQAVTDWKANRSRSYQKYLPEIAAYFNVSVDSLIGNTENTANATVAEIGLSEHEKLMISAYRSQPDMQRAVDRLLGIEADGCVYLYSAAQSDTDRPDGVVRMSREQWENIKNAPETDEELI